MLEIQGQFWTVKIKLLLSQKIISQSFLLKRREFRRLEATSIMAESTIPWLFPAPWEILSSNIFQIGLMTSRPSSQSLMWSKSHDQKMINTSCWAVMEFGKNMSQATRRWWTTSSNCRQDTMIRRWWRASSMPWWLKMEMRSLDVITWVAFSLSSE